MKTKNIVIYIIICLIVIAGLAVWNAKGFKKELQYSSRKQIQLTNSEGIEISDIETIANEVLGDTRHIVQKVETFGNAVSIVSEEITEEQKTKIVEKFNEKYKTKIESDKIEIYSISSTRIKDVLKVFIIPGIITLALVAIYFIIKYNKIGWVQVCLKTILAPIVVNVLVFSIMEIFGIPFSRYTIALGVCICSITIFILTVVFEKQKAKIAMEIEKSK